MRSWRCPEPFTMLRTLLVASILLLFFPLRAQYTATVKTSVTKSEISGWRKWSNGTCSINYPGNWASEGSGPNDLTAAFTSPTDSTNRPRERVEVFVKTAGGMSLADYAKRAEQEVGERVSDPKILGANITDDAHTLEYTGELNGHPVQVKQESWLKDGQLWVITFTALPVRYNEMLYVADAMFASFTVK